MKMIIIKPNLLFVKFVRNVFYLLLNNTDVLMINGV